MMSTSTDKPASTGATSGNGDLDGSTVPTVPTHRSRSSSRSNSTSPEPTPSEEELGIDANFLRFLRRNIRVSTYLS